jgi:hypothetical protein
MQTTHQTPPISFETLTRASSLGGFVRELVAAMPIVILVCAVISASRVARPYSPKSAP